MTLVNRWDPDLYEGRFAFVWNLGSGLIDLLEPQPGERILDLGSGTGHLTHQIAERGAFVSGLDSSPAMVAQARANYPKLQFVLGDAADFSSPEQFDAVFSNAALHWMQRPEAVAACVWKALRPGGRFVAEFGSKGNISAILDAIAAETGTRETIWYFPSIGEYAPVLERCGFRITHAFEFDRDTELEGDRGMEQWLEMFAGAHLAKIPPDGRAAAIQRIAERLRPALFREGHWFADYKRLRIRAQKEIR
jgi:trans-aconitate methyltransferase